MSLPALGFGALMAVLVWQTKEAMSVDVKQHSPVYDDAFQTGINIRAWINSNNPTTSSQPPANTNILTDPTHPGGDPRQISKHVYTHYLQDVARNTAHVVDTTRNKGDFIVLGDQDNRNVLLVDELSGNWAWRSKPTGNFGYPAAVPHLSENEPIQIPHGGQMGNFNGLNAHW